MKNFLIVIAAFVLFSCGQKDQKEKDIARIEVDLEVKRFDLAFSAADRKDLPLLKSKFPYLFPEQYPDSIWYNRMEDTLQVKLFEEVSALFSGFDSQTKALTELYRHVKYYFPEIEVPTVVTVTSDVDYKNRVIYADSLLLIGLDNYLGEGHEFYGGIQEYIRKDLVPERIVADVAQEIAVRKTPGPRNRTFIARMVYYGKIYYTMQQLLPEEPEELIIGYSEDQLAWARANESEIWRFFIDGELLFSTNSKLDQRFLDPAPFSKFYLELDNESPGRLGRFMGWKIVQAYMENNEVSLQQMLVKPADELFNESLYKPSK